MNPLPVRSLVLLAALAGPMLRAATPLNRLAGADTVLLVTVDDLASLHKNWRASPMGRTWSDPQMVKYLAPLREAMHIDEWDARCQAKTGKSVDELVAGFGPMMLTVGDMSAALADDSGKTAPPVLVAVDLRDNRDAVLKLIKEEHEKSGQTELTEEFQGETLHLEMQEADKQQNLTACWATIGPVMFVSNAKAAVQQAIANYKRGGAEAPYVDTESYQEEVRRLPGAQIRVVFDWEHLLPAVMEAVQRKAARQKPNPLGFTPDGLMKAVGLDTFRCVSVAWTIGTKESTMVGSIAFGEPRGITKLLAAPIEGGAPEPTFLSGDWVSVSAGRARLDLLFPVVEEIFHTLGPALDGIFQQQILNLDKRTGVDLKRDIFGNLGDEIYNAQRFETADGNAGGPGVKPHQLLVLSLNDPKTFETALHSLITGLMGPAAAQVMQTREYMGSTIHTMVKPGGAPGAAPTPVLAYAVAQRYWVLGIGSDELVEMAIHNLSSPQPSYWRRPEVSAALGKLPEGAIGYGYIDLHRLAPIYLDLLAQGMQQGRLRVKNGKITFAPPPSPRRPPAPPPNQAVPEEGAPPAAEEPPEDPGTLVVNPDEKPSGEAIARYWASMASGNYRDAHGVYTVIRLEHPQ